MKCRFIINYYLACHIVIFRRGTSKLLDLVQNKLFKTKSKQLFELNYVNLAFNKNTQGKSFQYSKCESISVILETLPLSKEFTHYKYLFHFPEHTHLEYQIKMSSSNQ